MPPAEKKWDSNAERDLCVAIIMGAQEGDRMRYNWPKVHSSMQALGYPFTKDAISQHFSKSIMRDFKGRHGEPSDSASPAPTPKKTATRKRATSAKGRKKKVASEEEDDDVDETTVESPAPKKMKRKKEEDNEDVKTDQDDAPERKHERSAAASDAEVQFENWLESGKAAEE
ncbi:hypothetical protein FSARC_10172 [Fusarium sarcochroum]|uniref:DNA-binding protein n=1 Tax=Fusarium sarcochroum TaxID=1208366 RepID=A0A8H4TP57_9HYPO|nr:hypothetical protein FSARC_10172 [Fusarium sarcochroum]